jgi:hypothetical protein
MMFVDPFEQAVQSQNQKNRNGLVEQFHPYADAEERLGGPETIGRRRCVSRHDQLAGDIDESEGGADGHQQIQGAGDSDGLPL